jgi:hypothetical protein
LDGRDRHGHDEGVGMLLRLGCDVSAFDLQRVPPVIPAEGESRRAGGCGSWVPDTRCRAFRDDRPEWCKAWDDEVSG